MIVLLPRSRALPKLMLLYLVPLVYYCPCFSHSTTYIVLYMARPLYIIIIRVCVSFPPSCPPACQPSSTASARARPNVTLALFFVWISYRLWAITVTITGHANPSSKRQAIDVTCASHAFWRGATLNFST
jgi:hypothetical protein